MSTVNLITKDVLVDNNNSDPISLLRKGLIKRDLLVGAKEFITIPNAPENFAKRINSTVPVTIDGTKVKIGDSKTIESIYATATSIYTEVVTEKTVNTIVEEVPVEFTHEEPIVPEKTIEEPTPEIKMPSEEELREKDKAEQLSKDIAQAEVGVNEIDDIIDEDGTDEEVVESNNNSQNNQFNYKKKRRR